MIQLVQPPRFQSGAVPEDWESFRRWHAEQVAQSVVLQKWFVQVQQAIVTAQQAILAAHPTVVIPAGAIDGSNAVFTIPSGSVLQIFRQGLLVPPDGYTVTGLQITFLPSNIPQMNDTLLVVTIASAS